MSVLVYDQSPTKSEMEIGSGHHHIGQNPCHVHTGLSWVPPCFHSAELIHFITVTHSLLCFCNWLATRGLDYIWPLTHSHPINFSLKVRHTHTHTKMENWHRSYTMAYRGTERVQTEEWSSVWMVFSKKENKKNGKARLSFVYQCVVLCFSLDKYDGTQVSDWETAIRQQTRCCSIWTSWRQIFLFQRQLAKKDPSIYQVNATT